MHQSSYASRHVISRWRLMVALRTRYLPSTRQCFLLRTSLYSSQHLLKPSLLQLLQRLKMSSDSPSSVRHFWNYVLETPVRRAVTTFSNMSRHTTNTYVKKGPRILSILPVSFRPYAELMRLDRPMAFYYYYWPHLLGLLSQKSVLERATSSNRSEFVYVACGLALYTVLLRGYACAWNDAIDAPYDARVERCKNRPVPRGALSRQQALTFSFAVFAAATTVTKLFPVTFQKLALANVFWYGVYPFMKRVTDMPQVWLGFAMAWGVFLGASAELETSPSQTVDENLHSAILRLFRPRMAFLYVANILWPLIYDTIYAQQDIHDDVKAGVKSLAIAMGSDTKLYLYSLAVLQSSCLALHAVQNDHGLYYCVVAVFGTFFALLWMIHQVNLDKPLSCAWWFRNGNWIAGGAMVGGLLLENAAKKGFDVL